MSSQNKVMSHFRPNRNYENEMHELLDLFYCYICEESIKELPIKLTCCKQVICKRHVEDQIKDKKSKIFKCDNCDQEHSEMESKAFPRDEIATTLIGLYNQDLVPIYDHANFGMAKLASFLKEMSDIIRDPENLVHEIVLGLKRDVDLRRDKLKKNIDKISDEMIEKLDKYQQECFDNIKNANLVEKSDFGFINQMQAQLDEWEEKIVIDVNRNDFMEKILSTFPNDIKNIETKARENIAYLVEKLDRLKSELSMDKLWIYQNSEILFEEYKRELTLFEGYFS